MIQTVKDYEFIGEPAPSNYSFIGGSMTTKGIIYQLFPLPNETGMHYCLDIGFGKGELGKILNEDHPHISIDGIDAWHPTCKNQSLADSYRNIWCAKVEELPTSLIDDYDFIFLMDVIEHLEPQIAHSTLQYLLSNMKDGARLIVSTPLWFFPQGQIEPGDFEEHKCMIPVQSFLNLNPEMYNINPGALVGMFVLSKRSMRSLDEFDILTDRGYGMNKAQTEINRLGLFVDEKWHEL